MIHQVCMEHYCNPVQRYHHAPTRRTRQIHACSGWKHITWTSLTSSGRFSISGATNIDNGVPVLLLSAVCTTSRELSMRTHHGVEEQSPRFRFMTGLSGLDGSWMHVRRWWRRVDWSTRTGTRSGCGCHGGRKTPRTRTRCSRSVGRCLRAPRRRHTQLTCADLSSI
jgi:hypothetical protein